MSTGDSGGTEDAVSTISNAEEPVKTRSNAKGTHEKTNSSPSISKFNKIRQVKKAESTLK